MRVIERETTEAGNVYEVEAYVDPFPGRKGTDIITEDCGFCLGTGLYQGPSGLNIYTPTVGHNDKGCFKCMGTGKYSRKVSSYRTSARRAVKARNARAAQAADYEANREAREAQEKLDAMEEAYAENDRRDSLPEGFWGDYFGEVVELEATVTKSGTYEGTDFYGNKELKGFVIFTNRAGQVAKYFTTWKNADKFEEGQQYNIKASIKNFRKDEYGEYTLVTKVTIKK